MKDTISFKFRSTFPLELLKLDENKIDKESDHFSVKKLLFNNYHSLT